MQELLPRLIGSLAFRNKNRTVEEHGAFGIEELFRPDDGWDTDVVFIHGLDGHRLNTWTSKTNHCLWPKDLLPNELDRARILTFGYNAKIVDPAKYVSTNKISDHASNLLRQLVDHRCGERRKLIFVCHSLGGLVCKNALVLSREYKSHAEFHHIHQDTLGIVFMGTPHRGSRFATYFAHLVRVVACLRQSNKHLIRVLKPLSTESVNTQKSFERLLCSREEESLPPLYNLCCYEEVPMRLGRLVVEKDSAVLANLPGSQPEIGVHADHSSMTKFNNERDTAFRSIHKEMSRWVQSTSWSHESARSMDGPVTPAKAERLTSPIPVMLNAHASRMTQVRTPSRTVSSTKVSSRPSESSDGNTAQSSTPSSDSLIKVPRGSGFVAAQHINRLPIFYPTSSLPSTKHKFVQQRPSEIDEIANILLPTSRNNGDEHFVSCIVTGSGGTGKTELAYQFIEKHQGSYGAIIFLTADNITRLYEQYDGLARKLGLVDADRKTYPERSRLAVLAWLDDPVKGLPSGDNMTEQGTHDKKVRWLLVFDNAESDADICWFWPRAGQGTVLLTTRHLSILDMYRSGSGHVHLDQLSQSEAVSLLCKYAGDDDHDEEAAAISVVDYVRAYPLGVSQLGSIIRRQGLTISKFLEIYPRKSDMYNLITQRHHSGGYEHNLATVWASGTLKPESLAILSLLSMLDPECIPEQIISPATTISRIEAWPRSTAAYYEARAELIDTSLTTHVQDNLYMHRIVQEVTRARLYHDEQAESVFQEAVVRIAAQWPFLNRNYKTGSAGSTSRWSQCDTCLPHILHLRQVYIEISERVDCPLACLELAELLLEAAQFQLERGLVHEVMPLLASAQEIYDTQPETDVQEQLGKLFRARFSSALQSNNALACLRFAEEGLRLEHDRHKAMGCESSILAVAYNDLGVARAMNNDWELALEALGESQHVRERLLEFTRDKLFSPLYNKALVHHHQGKHVVAIGIIEGVIADREELLADDKRITLRDAALHWALGLMYRSLYRQSNDPKEAKEHIDQALQQTEDAVRIAQQSVGSTNQGTLVMKYYHARIFADMGHFGRAREVVAEVLNEMINMEPYYPRLAAASWLYAQCCFAEHDDDEAREWRDLAAAYYNAVADEQKDGLYMTGDDIAGLVTYEYI